MDCSTGTPATVHLRRHGVLILVLGIVSIETMSTDIFPVIDIPVVTVIWTYSGTSPGRDGEALHDDQ